ncbi:hypothetical protein [Flavobacterium sp. YO12]|nr:hypothetical protein [Flavobacterium sp. YO12]
MRKVIDICVAFQLNSSESRVIVLSVKKTVKYDADIRLNAK